MSDKNFLYMKRAIQLAEKGVRTVSPNPMVGAVLVKNGIIIGHGFHEKKGEPHAEVIAINSAIESVEGSDLYCTLEPCCHTNKLTPPCVNLIIEKKIKRVFIASIDPNPEVAGKGILALRNAGIEVVQGILEKDANELNKVFFKNMKKGLPFVHLKAGITLDGRICSETGSSKWITSEEARAEVHKLRERYDAVMIGKGTMLADNPSLTARKANQITKDPFKIIVGNLTPNDLKNQVFENSEKVINIFSDKTSFTGKTVKLRSSFEETLKEIFQLGICSVLVEGGAKLMSAFFESNLYDRATLYISPKLIGNGKTFFNSNKITAMDNALSLGGEWRITNSGEAVLEVVR